MTVPITPPQNVATGVPLVQLAGGGDSPYTRTPLGYEQLSIDTVTYLNVPDDALIAVINVEAQAVRWTDDASWLDADTGMLVQAGVTFDYTGNLPSIAFTDVVSGAILNVSYYR